MVVCVCDLCTIKGARFKVQTTILDKIVGTRCPNEIAN